MSRLQCQVYHFKFHIGSGVGWAGHVKVRDSFQASLLDLFHCKTAVRAVLRLFYFEELKIAVAILSKQVNHHLYFFINGLMHLARMLSTQACLKFLY